MKYFVFGMITSLIFIWLNIVIWGGKYFDSKCIKGKLKPYHVQAINDAGWMKTEIKENDRIIARECSELLRKLHLRENLKNE